MGANLDMYNILTGHKDEVEEEDTYRVREKAAWKRVAIVEAAILILLIAVFCIAFTNCLPKTSGLDLPETSVTEASDASNSEVQVKWVFDGIMNTEEVVEESVEEDVEEEEASDIGETENENELIEEALFDSGYFREDIPLDGDTQAELRAACEEFGVEYTLMLALIHQETAFCNVTGDNGNSIGLCQVQPRWNGERMAELGVTDLTVPYQNFRVACSLLSELLDKYGTETKALTAYNSGKPGNSRYAREVLAYKAELEG